ncbi:cytochrome-c oxidase [Leisingera daeponensis]|uniref:cytochrome-c oxidase n=1 Tax=Leisingera daeponensis TaxID=405746 RepID=UPI001C98524E|nr:cytochrome-c oxidase [Leisingera daeponensis]MBY6058971.1 cytochrome-c oxidase [Leisingera daeponensis]
MKRMIIALALLFVPAMEAAAHHPGERIDEVMAEREPAFEPTDLRRTPQLALTDASGAAVQMHDMKDKVVVLSFIPRTCGAPCAAQQALLREVQESVNVTPMREMVVFLTAGAATDPGWDGTNWSRVAVENGTVPAAASFAALSERESEAPMVHIIARGGRHAGIFHGVEFGRVNLVLYINELTNAPLPEPGLLDRVLGIFN